MSRRRSRSRPRGRHDRLNVAEPRKRARSSQLRHRRGAEPAIDLTEGAAASPTSQPGAPAQGATATSGRNRRRHRLRIHSDATMRPEVNGLLAALTVGALSLLLIVAVTVLGWVLAADHSSLAAMFDIAIFGWLAVHLIPVGTPGGAIWLPPLVLTAAVAWLSFRVGRTALRRGTFYDSQTRWRVIGSAVGGYAALATALAFHANGEEISVPLLLVPFAAAAIFSVGFVPAITRQTSAWHDLWQRLPGHIVAEFRAAVRGLAVLGIVAAAVLVGAMVASIADLNELWADLRPGFSGTVVLALGALVYAPTAVVWVASFLAGPGFSAGAGGYSPFAVDPAEMPDFPLLAAVPESAPAWYLLGGLGVLAAGVVSAWAVARNEPRDGVRQRALPRVRAAGLAAVLAGIAGLVTHGTLGGALSDFGPPPLAFAAAVFVWFVLGAVVVSAGEALGVGGRVRGRRQSAGTSGAVVVSRPDEEPQEWMADRTVVLEDSNVEDLGRS